MARKMKDSGIDWIGEIPEEWGLLKYKRFAQSGMGATILKEDLISEDHYENAIPVYSATNSNRIFGYVTNSSVILNENDFVIPARGNSIGFITIVKDKLATSTQTTIYSKIKGIHHKFLFYCSCGLKDHWFEFDQTAIPQITVRQVDNNLVPIPPTKEQSRIANYLDKKVSQIDYLIEKTKETIEEYKAYKQSLITEVVTKGLDKNVKMKDSGIEWIGEIPEGSRLLPFKRIATIMSNLVNPENYSTYKQLSPDKIEKNTGILMDCDTVQEIGVVSSNHLFYKGQIIYSKVRPKLNKVVIAPFDGLCSADMYPIETTINTEFLKYYMLSHAFLTQVTINDNRVKMPKINQDELNQIIVSIPPNDMQCRIVRYLNNKLLMVSNIIKTKYLLITELESYKKSLIYEVVTGKREV